MLLALAGIGGLPQRGQVAGHLRVGRLARRGQRRRVAAAPADLAGELGERGLARGERGLEPVEHGAVGAVERLAALQPRGQDAARRLAAGAGAPAGQEQPVGGVLQRLRALQALDAVVGERAPEVRHEALGQALGLRVERAQERVQVLLRAAERGVEAVGVRAVERAHVRVELEQAALLGRVAGRRQRRERAGDLVGRDVVAEHGPAEPLQRAGVELGGLEAQALALLLGGAVLVLDRVDHQQRLARRHLGVGGHEHLADAPVDGRGQRALHLHALGHGDHVAGLHLVARRDGDRHDHARRVAADQAALVARDPVRDAVDLDEQVGVLQRGHGAVRAAAEAQPALVLGQLLDGRLDAGAVDLEQEAAGGGLADLEAVAHAAVQQLEHVADLRVGVRAAAPRERVERPALAGRRGLAERDRGLHERGVGVPYGLDVALRLEAVEPAGVDLARAQLRPAEQLEQEALVGRAVLDRDHRVGDGAAQPGDRLLARVAVGDDLRDHRVELRRDAVALGDAAVDADARAGRQAQERDPARRRREAAAGVLGVEADLDGVAAGGRRVALEPAAGRDVQLQADEVGARDRLGDRVLDLQARVDLHEGEAAAVGLVEELDGARAAVAGRVREADRGVGELALLLGRERRAGGLLDDLLVAALVAAVAHAERPDAALAVGHQLHLDVARGADEALHQHARVAEGLRGLGTGALEGLRDLVLAVDAAHAAPAAAGGGLDHQREAELAAVAEGVLDAVDRPAAPRRDGHAGLLGQALALDLVAERAHHAGVRPGEDDPQPVAELREGGVLGDEAPADPRRVGAGLDERALEALVVEVRAQRVAVAVRDHRGAEAVALVGLADEQRVALLLGVEGDDADRLVALLVELADGVDRAHRRLAAVDDGKAREGGSCRGHASFV